MPKKPHLGRDELIEQISLARAAGFKNSDEPREEEYRGKSPRKCGSTAEQRRLIVSELRPEGGVAAETVDMIESIVGLTVEILQYRADHSVSPEQEKKFRDLRGPIAQILDILEQREFEHLEEYVPHLRPELRVLQNMVELDQRKGRGRPQNPINERLKDLYVWLAKIWAEHRGWPTRYNRGDLGRDWGPFYRFLDACLTAADLPVRDHVIRSVINKRGPA